MTLSTKIQILLVHGAHIKYRPFYIEEVTEREKQSCLCIVCQNVHTKLADMNNFQKMEKLKPVLSVTEYLKSQKAETLDHAAYPERTSKKSVNYYVFETALETFVKQGKTKSYTRKTGWTRTNQCPICIHISFLMVKDTYITARWLIVLSQSNQEFMKVFLGNILKWTFR